jgi:lactate dehydrogenase-like 2-hydroxyacid dehydrogenase
MLATLRHMAYGHAELQKGVWRGGTMREAFMLSGKTVGIVGFGAIGKTVARLLAGFGCTILYTKPTPLPAEEEARLGARYATLDELLRVSDVVSLHCPMTPQTANMIDRAALSRMKRTAILVNVARRRGCLRDRTAAAGQHAARRREHDDDAASRRHGRRQFRADGPAHVQQHRAAVARRGDPGGRRRTVS